MALVEDPLVLLAVLLAVVAVSEALGRHPWGRKIGTALIAILIGAVLANARIIPPAGNGGPVYDPIFGVVTPAAIFLILLDANLKALRRAGGAMLLAFFIGAVGTCAGVVAAMTLTPVREVLGEAFGPIAGMFAATYIGGSANFNAVALHYGVIQDVGLYTAAVVVDNVMSAVWILLTLVLPMALYRTGLFGEPGARRRAESEHHEEVPATPLTGVLGLAVPLALALAALALSNALTAWLKGLGLQVPSVLILTTIALAVAQIPAVGRLTQAKPLGLYAIYLFLAVVGASADVAALIEAGRLGLVLMAFVAILVVVHGLVIVAAGFALKLEPEVIAVASNANIGGATTAFALAEAQGREDLVLPGILVGSLGTALGTYVGFAIAAWF